LRPFLKWPGNKYQIAHYIKAKLPPGSRLVEPFAGSGAVFLNTVYSQYLLADNNPDLISLYLTLQQEGSRFIEFCRSFFIAANNTREQYYYYRHLFNHTADMRLKAALLVYLNRHGYNGLVRYNNKGEYNVPFGRYKKPYFPQTEMHYFWEKSRQATFVNADFVQTMKQARPGDVVYCDPPYVPLSATANFTGYSRGGFSAGQQQELARLAVELSRQGIPVLISNHATEFTMKVYQGAELTRLKVQRSISCDGSKRGKADELLALFLGL
jgi:DNA adenine methylase